MRCVGAPRRLGVEARSPPTRAPHVPAGRIYTQPYLEMEPTFAFVLEDDAGVCGYTFAAPDSARFFGAMKKTYLPRVCAAFPRPRDPHVLGREWTNTDHIHAAYHDFAPHFPPSFEALFPAHLHIDLVARAQGKGLGTPMILTQLEALAAAGVPGVYLEMSRRNHRAYQCVETRRGERRGGGGGRSSRRRRGALSSVLSRVVERRFYKKLGFCELGRNGGDIWMGRRLWVGGQRVPVRPLSLPPAAEVADVLSLCRASDEGPAGFELPTLPGIDPFALFESFGATLGTPGEVAAESSSASAVSAFALAAQSLGGIGRSGAPPASAASRSTSLDASSGLGFGALEGFYGRPWSEIQRRDLFARMRSWGLNLFMYAPKDDRKHRAEWRKPYTAGEAAMLRSLFRAAREQGVEVIYAISPGLDIRYNHDGDVNALQGKLRQVAGLGATMFALLWDDIDPELSPADKAAFGSLAAAQCAVSNAVFLDIMDLLSFAKPRAPTSASPSADGDGRSVRRFPRFLFCPTHYCGAMVGAALHSKDGVQFDGLISHAPDVAERALWDNPYVTTVGAELIHEVRLGNGPGKVEEGRGSGKGRRLVLHCVFFGSPALL